MVRWRPLTGHAFDIAGGVPTAEKGGFPWKRNGIFDGSPDKITTMPQNKPTGGKFSAAFAQRMDPSRRPS
jgi:hypothetical protein